MENGVHSRLPRERFASFEQMLRDQAQNEGVRIGVRSADNGDGTVDVTWTVLGPMSGVAPGLAGSGTARLAGASAALPSKVTGGAAASAWGELVQAAREAVIPAPVLRAVTLAQWIEESGRGKSRLAWEHCNFAGLKWRPEMKGFATPVLYEAHDGTETYCGFPSVEVFIAGYWRFIGRSVYSGWQAYADDPHGFIKFLEARGYAGDQTKKPEPTYSGRVINLIPEAELLLSTPAGATELATLEEDRPSKPHFGESPADHLPHDRLPKFVTLGEISHTFHGKRPNGLEGAIVHYDAGRFKPRTGPDDLEFGAKNTLRWGQTAKYTYATISRNGAIYLPGNMDWQRWGSHAGKSVCPDTKRTDVSRFYVGFEVNSPGLLYPTQTSDVYAPWFNCVVDQNGNVITDASGRATIRDKSDEHYAANDVRIVKARNGNIAAGVYVPYTDAQFNALVAVMLWLRSAFPLTFRLDRVYGHDEVSPGRKVDPGGSLGKGKGSSEMTMAEFRTLLLREWADVQA
jgi:hypothetical protein